MKELEDIGIINKLSHIIKNNNFINKNINKRSAIALGHIFKAFPLPLDIRTEVVRHHYQILSNQQYILFNESIDSITDLS